jgi:predicted flap endonuclease-1-like 5' DNA nuclease
MFCNYFPLIVGLLSALTGAFIGWQLLKNSRLATVLGMVDEKDSHIEGLQSDLSTQRTHYTRLRNDHESLTGSLSEWKGKFGNATTELAILGAAKLALDADFSKHKTTTETTIVGLEGQIRDWKQKFQTLETAQKSLQGELETTRRDRDAKIADADAKLKTANAKITEGTAKLNDANAQITAIDAKLADVNAKITTADAKLKEIDAEYIKLHASHDAEVAQVKSWTLKANNFAAEKEQLNSSFISFRSDNDLIIKALEQKHQDVIAEKSRLETEKQALASSSNGEVTQLKTEKEALNTKIAKLEADNAEGYTYWNTRYASLETEHKGLQSNLQDLESEKSRLAAEVQNLTNEKTRLATDFDNEKSRLKTEAHRMKTESDGVSARLQAKEREYTEGVVQWQTRYNTLDGQLNGLRTERDDLTGKLRDSQRRTEAAAKDFEQRAFELDTEIKRLQDELNKKPAGVVLRDAAEVEAEQRGILERIRQKSASGGLKAFGSWGGGKGDNLKKLRGINPFVEKKMNAAGIYTYRQVAYLSADDQNELNGALELSKNKFQKEEWVFQAKRLIGLISDESPDVLLARIHGRMGELNFDRIGSASAESKDNLQLINFVTAFDEAKLNALGIFKFSQIFALSKTDAKLVNKIMEIEDGRIESEDWRSQASHLNSSAGEATLERIRGRRELVSWERIGRWEESQIEDLQVVSGIGLFIEQKLYALGIYRLEQIAKFNSADETEMNNILELVPGHIQGDEWTAQAKKLVKQRG